MPWISGSAEAVLVDEQRKVYQLEIVKKIMKTPQTATK
jgi:hypothetical protein